jgi:hypothetical protein
MIFSAELNDVFMGSSITIFSLPVKPVALAFGAPPGYNMSHHPEREVAP